MSKTLRLDHYLVQNYPEFNRSFITKLIDQRAVRVNSEIASKAGLLVNSSDSVEIDEKVLKNYSTQVPNIPVIYEDDDCIVINKPSGLLVHSKGAINYEPTVATWLKAKTHDLSGNRAGIVHRLDRGTSGVMICAKHLQAQKWLQKQFAQRVVNKSYVAVVSGIPQSTAALIDIPIERNPRSPSTFRASQFGKTATTNYSIIESNKDFSLLELKPETGRTHQIRVHLNHIGHPILGDTLYGGLSADRLYLHAWKLELTLPNHQYKKFSAAIPKKFTDIMR